ncbi:3-deoxy-manno-octulosonate cytidylyltransferase (CMP-KDO synthetase) [Sulfurivirga caldicuralii]|uniref:3-deoxy-manno-octulosonate cytidylyltransferase n=1 Tax=Sulfurivirga caldicuralii TaxID=364032 RepID=A0A1N6F6B2_9GAMM|nr:3-deoxy-manno-octulosonate cytidylyltransferase [Sulfurivirga caldicuralii]SIN90736.1 3-deoxy-manno-octulosonate cytidylyltransferase (CMP-KDO synthetase) [Sulfurivirga caldicuralii]
MNFKVVIPARLASSRLPGKVLLDVAGHPMLEWTWRNAVASGADEVVVATDSDKVAALCEQLGAVVCMTDPAHPSGTARLAEVVEHYGWDADAIVVNVQADEPMLPPQLVRQVARGVAHDAVARMATLCEPIDSLQTLLDPNAVKVLRDINDHAMIFTRAPNPWARDAFSDLLQRGVPDFLQDEKNALLNLSPYRRHIGLYAYRAGFVRQYVRWPACMAEQLENLEQLRVLHHGEKILVLDALCSAGVGVDTLQDLARVNALLAGRQPGEALPCG